MSLSLGLQAAAGAQLNAYWGQTGGLFLRDICDSGVQYATVSFINNSPEHGNGYPGSNFGANCAAEVYTNNGKPTLLQSSCTFIQRDIPYCQDKGVKVLLSIGGAAIATSQYDVSTEQKGVEFAEFLYNAFGPKKASWTGPRPFDTADRSITIDGFDLDLENKSKTWSNKPYIAMVKWWRQQSQKMYITAAPECVITNQWNTNQNDDLIANAQFDALFIQFYNNPVCDAIPGNQIGGGDNFSYDQFSTVISKGASKNAKIFIGLPASTDSATTGYIAPKAVKDLVCKYSTRANFGGLSLWDGTRAMNNKDANGKSFMQSAAEIVKYLCKDAPTTTSTTATSTKTSTTSSTVKSTTTSTTATSTKTSTTSSTVKSTTTTTTTSEKPKTTTTTTTTSEKPKTTTTTTTTTSEKPKTTTTTTTTSEKPKTTTTTTTSEKPKTTTTTTTTSEKPKTTTTTTTSEKPKTTTTTTSEKPKTTSTTTTSEKPKTTTTTTSEKPKTTTTTATSEKPKTTTTTTTTSEKPKTTTTTTSEKPKTTTTTKVTATDSTTSSGVIVTSSTQWSNSTTTSKPVSMTTSTVYTTSVHTVTKCPPTVTNCPVGHVTTETIALYTTVCPVTETARPHKPTTTKAPVLTTSTVYTTKTYTITKCPPYVTNCPVGQVTTETIPLYTTVCPVTETQTGEVPQPTASAPSSLLTSVRSTAVVPKPSEGCSGPGCPVASSTSGSGCTGPECPGASSTSDSGCTGPQCPGVAIPTNSWTGAPVGPSATPSTPVTAGASTLVLGLTGLVAMVIAQVLVL